LITRHLLNDFKHLLFFFIKTLLIVKRSSLIEKSTLFCGDRFLMEVRGSFWKIDQNKV
jgi:hypothetical protein